MKSSRDESVVSSKPILTTRRTALRALAGIGTLGAFGAFAPTPVAAVPTQPAGTGAEGDPYVITTVQELQWVGTGGPRNAYYVLGNDIDASATAGWNGGAGFIPIGGFPTSNMFSGSFDGQGYTISELTINRSTNYVGLFGVVATGATIESVHLTDVDVTSPYAVGGLVGQNDGMVRNSSVSGRITGTQYVGGLVAFNNPNGTVSGSEASGTVTGNSNIGGLVASSRGVVESSVARGTVTGSQYVGGLVGFMGGTVSDSEASGKITASGNYAGGLVGFSFGTVSTSEASGKTVGINDVGGLVGFNVGSVRDSEAKGRVTGSDDVGGLVGDNRGTVCGSTARGSVSGDTGVGDVVGDGNAAQETCS